MSNPFYQNCVERYKVIYTASLIQMKTKQNIYESVSGKMNQHQISNGRTKKSVKSTETDVCLKFAQGISLLTIL